MSTSTSYRVIPENAKIVIAGAGAIGCFVGGLLAAQGHNVCLWGRPRIIDVIAEKGLRVADSDGLDRHIDAHLLSLSTSPECLVDADIILLAAKSLVTESIAADIAEHAPEKAMVLSLQNGVRNPRVLRDKLKQDVVATMIPFNIVHNEDNRFYRGTFTAEIVMEWRDELSAFLSGDLIKFNSQADFNEIAWGKLLLNINNAINALGGLPLKEQLMDRQWRRLMADVVEESIDVMSKAGITHQSVAPVSMTAFCRILRLPTFLFRLIANSMLKVDPQARASMWEDLQQNRLTEIDEFQGLIIDLAAQHHCQAPLNQKVYDLVKKHEKVAKGSPNLSVSAIRA